MSTNTPEHVPPYYAEGEDDYPGTRTADPSELHQNAVEQEYHTAGGSRKLGEDKPVAYKRVANPT